MEGNVIIRMVRADDDISLSKMIRRVFEEHRAPRVGSVYSDPTTDNLSLLFKAPGSVLWVAEENGEAIGCCGIYSTEGLSAGCAELVKFYIAPEARGKGIGKKLMEQCISSARALGYRQLYLESIPQFSKAVHMYEKLGFRNLAGPLGNSGHTACNIWMLKEL